MLPDRWPRLLVLDSKPLGIRPYGAVPWTDWGGALPGGALLAAAGRDEDEGIARAWRVSFAGDETHHSWLRFFEELPGDPEWVVADRAKGISKAVEIRWPDATIFDCSWHLSKNLVEAAYRDGIYFPGSPFESLIRAAFHSVAEWESLFGLAEAKGAANVMTWITDNDGLIRHQIDLRAAFLRRPRSNGAAERAIKTVDGFIGKRRRNFRNAGRLTTVLGLMTANVREVGDPLTYARLVREFILADGSPDLNGGMDRGAWVNAESKTLASLAEVLLLAGGVKVTAKRASDLNAKARSVQATADGFNVERARLGLPLIEVRISKGGSPSVSTKGKMLADFYEFATEWDDAKNGRGPEGVGAGFYATKSWWRCAQGHSSEATVSDRLIRLLRCQRCVTSRADESTSLAAVHPQTLADWDGEGNQPLTPQSIRSTYPKVVSWRCLAGLSHPVYRASIGKHLRDGTSCPLCRKMRPARNVAGDLPF